MGCAAMEAAPPMMEMMQCAAPSMMGCAAMEQGGASLDFCSGKSASKLGMLKSAGIKKKESASRSRSHTSPEGPKRGKATAARVSRGSEVDTWKGLTVKKPQRNSAEHVTVTVVIYNTVAGGVPNEEDVARAVEDMEELYKQCAWSGKLADAGADFMKQELTVADIMKIEQKVVTQPYTAPSVRVVGFDAFPMDEDEAEVVHSNVICDATDTVIVGVRYHKKGADYDLCESEFKKLSPAEKAVYEMIS